MSSRCNDELVQLFVEGALEPVERAVVAEHIRLCPSCQQRVAAYKSLLWDLSRPAPDPEPLPPELDALSDSLMAAWVKAAAPKRAGWGSLVTTFATSNPLVTAPAHGLAKAGRAAGRAGAAGLVGLARFLRKRVIGR